MSWHNLGRSAERPRRAPRLTTSLASRSALAQRRLVIGSALGAPPRLPSSAEVSGRLVGPTAFKAAGTGDPRPAGSIPVHLRNSGLPGPDHKVGPSQLRLRR